jgi:hypothetical protein
MSVKFDVKYKFKVNGKEYSSLDEMPAPIRETYEKAVANKEGIEQGAIASVTAGKIMFNGQEYASVDSMPADVRQMYETIMKTIKSGEISAAAKVNLKIGGASADSKDKGIFTSAASSKPIAPKSFLSPAVLVLLGIMLALFVGLFMLMDAVPR